MLIDQVLYGPQPVVYRSGPQSSPHIDVFSCSIFSNESSHLYIRVVDTSVGRLVGRSVGWSVGQSVALSVGSSVRPSVHWSVNWLLGRLVGRSVRRSVGW